MEFLKKEKNVLKNLLNEFFIQVYSQYWTKISNDERLINMNKSFKEIIIEPNKTDKFENFNSFKKKVIFSFYVKKN